MKKNLLTLLDSGLGFLVGVIAAGVVWLIFWLLHIFTDFTANFLTDIIFSTVGGAVIEETAKFLPLRFLFKSRFVLYGIMIGIGFGLMESFAYTFSFFNEIGPTIFTYRIGPTLTHIVIGSIVGFCISKRKGWLGLILAILLHSLSNFLSLL